MITAGTYYAITVTNFAIKFAIMSSGLIINTKDPNYFSTKAM